MSTQDGNDKNSNISDAKKIDNEASNIAKNIVGIEQSNSNKSSQPKPTVQKILAPAKPHISIVNGETKKQDPKDALSSKKKGFSIPFFGNKKNDKVKLGSSTKISKKFALIPIALIAVFGSYLIVSTFAVSPTIQGNEGLFNPIDPKRILDTRSSSGVTQSKPIAPGQTIDIQIAGNGGIPANDVSAAVINLTAVSPTTNGHARAWASDTTMPDTSVLNFTANTNIANSITVKLGKDGKIKLYNGNGNTHYLVDTEGYFSSKNGQYGAHFQALSPTPRALDTRLNNQSPIAPGQTIDIQIAGNGGIPANDVSAAVINLTAVSPTTNGHARAWASDTTMPDTSVLNFTANTNIANSITVKLGKDGKIKLYNGNGNTHYLVDLMGYYYLNNDQSNNQQGRYIALTNPKRIFSNSKEKINNTSDLTVGLTGAGGIPKSNVQAVTINLTVINSTANGHSRIWPKNTNKPSASVINFTKEKNIANTLIVPVSKDGAINAYHSNGEAMYLIDVLGYYTDGANNQTYQKQTKVLNSNDLVINNKTASKDYLNKIINDTKYNKIVFTKQSEPWLVDPIFITRDDIEISIEPETIIGAKSGYKYDERMFTIWGQDNIKITGNKGALLTMPMDKYKEKTTGQPTNEHRHTIHIAGSNNVTINNISIDKTGGDGIYVGSIREIPSSNININSVNVYNAARNGISIISVDGLSINNSVIDNTKNFGLEGNTGPWAGIDFEPNHSYEVLKNININNTVFSNNQLTGVEIALMKLNETSQPISININNCKLFNNSYMNDGRNTSHTGYWNNKDNNKLKGRININCNIQKNNKNDNTPIFAIRDQSTLGTLEVYVNNQKIN